MNRLLTVTFLGIFLYQCSAFFPKDEYENIPKDWILKYNKGDVLVYRSNRNNIDSFSVKEIKRNYDILDKTYYIEQYYISFLLIDTLNVKNKKYTIESGVSINPERMSLHWLYFSSQSDNSNYFNRMQTEKYLLNGKYYNVYRLPRDTFSSFWPDTISSLLYDGKYGVLRYDYKTGEYFELQVKD
jgi:hypothetical protein